MKKITKAVFLSVNGRNVNHNIFFKDDFLSLTSNLMIRREEIYGFLVPAKENNLA